MDSTRNRKLTLRCPGCRNYLVKKKQKFYCNDCDMTVGVDRDDFLDFMLQEELDDELKEFYEEEGTKADEEGGPRINAQKFKIPNVLSVLPESICTDRYLDMGCGGGWIMEALIPKLEPDLGVGVDISATRLTEARERNPESIFFRTPVENVPIDENSFDLITCLDVIEHIKKPYKLLREAHRLSPKLVIKFPIEDTIFDRFQKEYWWPFKRQIKTLSKGDKSGSNFEAHLHRFDFDSARKLLRQNGFEIKAEHVILNPWTEGESFMYPPAYNITENTNKITKLDFYLKRYALKFSRMFTHAITGNTYYKIFNSGIYFYCQRNE